MPRSSNNAVGGVFLKSLQRLFLSVPFSIASKATVNNLHVKTCIGATRNSNGVQNSSCKESKILERIPQRSASDPLRKYLWLKMSKESQRSCFGSWVPLIIMARILKILVKIVMRFLKGLFDLDFRKAEYSMISDILVLLSGEEHVKLL